MSKFQVFLKDNTRLDFDGKCNTYEIKQSGFCAFSNEDGNKSKILALIPKENILYIRNYPYMRVGEEKENINND